MWVISGIDILSVSLVLGRTCCKSNKWCLPSLHFLKIYILDAGVLCMCQFSADKQWYRAKIIKELMSNQWRVKFIDYGNTEVSFVCLCDLICNISNSESF